MQLLTAIVKSTRKFRDYVRSLQRSREELANSIPEENALPPIPPSDHKHPK
jgi:hypothetical protein